MELDYKSVAILIAIVDFVLYVAFIWGRYGVQKSISISFYDLPEDARFTFRIFIWIMSIAIILSGIGWDNNMLFIAGGLLSFVGFFTRIKIQWKYLIHMIGAIGGIVSCFVGMILENFKVGILVLLLIAIQSLLSFIKGDKEHVIWNVEVACFIYLILSLLYLVNIN